MNVLLEIRQKLARALDAEAIILGALVADNRDTTPGEKEELRKLNVEKSRLQDQLANAQRHAGDRASFENFRAGIPPVPVMPGQTGVSRGESRARKLFGEPRGVSEFRSLTEMASIVLSGRADERLLRSQGANEGAGAEGGFLVSEQLTLEVFDQLLTTSTILSRATILPIGEGYGSRLMTQFDCADRSDGSIYGFSGAWCGEGETVTVEKPSLKFVRLSPKKLMILSAVTTELMEDAVSGSGDAIADSILKALRFQIDRCLIRTGTGAGQPQALLNCDYRITVSKGSTGAGSISYANIAAMESRLLPELNDRAIWLAAPSTKAALMQLSVITITDVAASHVPALVMQNGQWTLNGRPLVFTEHCSPVGTEGDLILADLSMFGIGLKRDFRLDRSDSVYFTSDEQALRATVRLDAASRLHGVVTPSGGGDTLSWLVTLQSR